MGFNLRSLLAVAVVAVCMGAAASVASAQCDMGDRNGCGPYTQLALQASSNLTLSSVPCDMRDVNGCNPYVGMMLATLHDTSIASAPCDMRDPGCNPLQVPTLASKLSETQLALHVATDDGETTGPVLVSVMKSL